MDIFPVTKELEAPGPPAFNENVKPLLTTEERTMEPVEKGRTSLPARMANLLEFGYPKILRIFEVRFGNVIVNPRSRKSDNATELR